MTGNWFGLHGPGQFGKAIKQTEVPTEGHHKKLFVSENLKLNLIRI